MNRDQKLALVIGFALVLVVGVRISDHYSSVQQPRLEGGSLVAPPLQALAEGGGSPLPSGWGELIVTEPGFSSEGYSEEVSPPALAQAEPAFGSSTPPYSQSGDDPRGRLTPPPAPPALGERNRAPGTGPTRIARGTTSDSRVLAPTSVPMTERRVVEPLVMELGDGRDSAASSVTRGLIDRIRLGMKQLPVAGEVNERPAGSTGASVERTSPTRSDATVSTAREHYVQPNESLYKIAERYYGQGRLWRQLAEANPGKVGKNGVIRPRVRLVLPAELAGRKLRGAPQSTTSQNSATPTEARERAAQPTTYTVAKGDTLSQIAQQTLGSSRRMGDIIQANSNLISDADEIRVGMKLKIPGPQNATR